MVEQHAPKLDKLGVSLCASRPLLRPHFPGVSRERERDELAEITVVDDLAAVRSTTTLGARVAARANASASGSHSLRSCSPARQTFSCEGDGVLTWMALGMYAV
jgi:hypothetical protein